MTKVILHSRKMKEIRKNYDSQGQVELPDELFANTYRNEPYSERYEVYLGKAASFCFFFSSG